MYQLNYPVLETCTSSPILYQRHVPAQLSCTRDMCQLNYHVPEIYTGSTILHRGHVPGQLSCARVMYYQLNFGTCTCSTIRYLRHVPTFAMGQAQLSTSGDKYRSAFHYYLGGQVQLNYSMLLGTSTVHVIYPILHGGKYSLTIHFMGQVQLSCLVLHEDKYSSTTTSGNKIAEPSLLRREQEQLNFPLGQDSSATHYCMGGKYSSSSVHKVPQLPIITHLGLFKTGFLS